MPSRVSAVEQQRTILLYEERGVAATAEELGISYQAVCYRLQRAGLKPPLLAYRGAWRAKRDRELRARPRPKLSHLRSPERLDHTRSTRLVDELEAMKKRARS